MTGDFQAEDLIFMLKKINLDMEFQMKRCLERHDMSGTQVYFMVYILRHHPKGSYITEMCREIGVSKATLSVLVKKLREKGYLCFQETPGDVRKKKVVPTEKLIARGNEFLQRADRMETEICSCLNRQERDTLGELEQKILVRLDKMNGKEAPGEQDRGQETKQEVTT